MPETVPCLSCGGARAHREPHLERFLALAAPLRLARCGDCGFRFQSPRSDLDELEGRYLASDFYAEAHPVRAAHYDDFYSHRYQLLARWTPRPGRLLGVACLDGGYQYAPLAALGWRAEVFEFIRPLAEECRRVVGADVRVSRGWDPSCMVGEPYDAAASISLEHVPDPRGLLARVRRLVRHGAPLVLDVPYQLGSLKDLTKYPLRRLLGERGFHPLFKRNENEFHLSFFDPPRLRAMLADTGWRVVHFETYQPRHPLYLSNPRARWLQEAIYRVGGWFERGPSMEVVALADGAPAP